MASKVIFSDLKLTGKEGKPPKIDDDCKYVALYFSAHWCPPCRGFTPTLVDYYNKRKNGQNKFEIIFVSFDRDEGSFKGYFDSMPWLAVEFSEEKERQKLADQFGVQGIPALIILKPDGTLLSKDGRGKVSSDAELGD